MDSTHQGEDEQYLFSQHEEPQYAFYLNDLNEFERGLRGKIGFFSSASITPEKAQFELHSSITILQKDYQALYNFHQELEEEKNGHQGEIVNEIIYSPNQFFLQKKAQEIPAIEGLDHGEPCTFRKLSCDNPVKRKHSLQFERQPEKKMCMQVKIEEHSTTITEHEEEEIQCKIEDHDDLERLVDVIKLECQQFQHLDCQQLPYQPTQDQEKFLLTYLREDSIIRMKRSIDEEIAHGEETKQFLSWVGNLCSQTNHKQLKEIGRKQKVQKYLQKKYNRTYEKKVHYHIRQKVAEERLRVKGRFVTWGQALHMLDEAQDHKKSWNSLDYLKVKKMLHDKFGAAKSVKSKLI